MFVIWFKRYQKGQTHTEVIAHTYEVAVASIWKQCANSMEQSFFLETDNCSASLEIFRLLCNPKVQCHFQKSSALAPILSQMNPAHILTLHLFKILPSTPAYFKWFLLLVFRLKICMPFSCIPSCYTSHPLHSPWVDHPNNKRTRYVIFSVHLLLPVIGSDMPFIPLFSDTHTKIMDRK